MWLRGANLFWVCSLQAGFAFWRAAHGKSVRSQPAFDVLPGNWRSDRKAGSCPRRVGAYAGRAASIPEVIEEKLAGAARKLCRGNIATRIRLGELLRQAFRV